MNGVNRGVKVGYTVACLDNGVGSLAAHVVDGVLVTEPVRAFDLLNVGKYQHKKRTVVPILAVSYICHLQSSSVMFLADM
jgi:hypothetical protein